MRPYRGRTPGALMPAGTYVSRRHRVCHGYRRGPIRSVGPEAGTFFVSTLHLAKHRGDLPQAVDASPLALQLMNHPPASPYVLY